MAAFGPILVTNIYDSALVTTSATVSYDHTYSPVGYIQPGVAKWEDRSSGIAVGFPSLTMSVRPPNKGSRIFKVTGKLSIPTLEAISGANVAGLTPAQQKAYECSAILELLFPERSTAAEREILRSQLASLLFTTINASDDVPTDLSASPFTTAISAYDRPY
jgi:hypothetical protein